MAKKVIYLSLILCTLLSLIVDTSAFAQKTTLNDKIKSKYLYSFGKHIKWDENVNFKEFKIGFYDKDKTIYNFTTKFCSKREIKGKKVKTVYFKNYKRIKDVQILFIGKDNIDKVKDIYNILSGTNTLIVTDSCITSKYSMINFLPLSLVRLQTNEPNLQIENFKMPGLLKAFGTKHKEDWEELYFEIKKQEKKIININEELDQNKLTLKNQIEQLSLMSNDLEQVTNEVMNKKAKLINQDQEIVKQQKKINGQKNILKDQLIEIKSQKQYIIIFGFILILLLVLAFFIYKSYRIKKSANKKLEEKNIKIITQKRRIETQRDLVTEQKEAITDSIEYSKKIQKAILSPDKLINKLVPNNFILNKPRDIVSGDFYWFKEINGKIFIAVADCTGHGVPGALMSMLGISALNNIVAKNNILSAGNILDELRLRIIESLHQSGKSGGSKDGMDISLCIIDKETLELNYAGANNPIYIVRSNLSNDGIENYSASDKSEYHTLYIINPDKMPIGIYTSNVNNFSDKKVKLTPEDTVYMFSDGYPDQFGGPNDKKFKYKQLRDLLLNIQSHSIKEQGLILDNTIEKWKGNKNQIDDILFVGFKVL